MCCVIQTFSFLELASHIFGLSVLKTLIENNNKSQGIKKTSIINFFKKKLKEVDSTNEHWTITKFQVSICIVIIVESLNDKTC